MSAGEQPSANAVPAEKVDWEPVHAFLARHAQQRPEAPFLLAEPGLSYGQAARWVADVASRHLEGCAGGRVALWMDKGNAYALSILAALHAGCAYVPLDGAQPAQRAQLILQDAQPCAVIADHEHASALLDQGLPASVTRLLLLSDRPLDNVPAGLRIDRLDVRLDDAAPMPLAPFAPTQKGDLGALLYTSGSTGTPKGVQLSHANLSNFVRWCVREFQVSPDDRFLNLASFNFDLSTFDLFASLQAGAALYIGSERETSQVGKVAELLQRQAITVFYTVPSMLGLLNRVDAWRALPDTLRRVVFAGEVMPKAQLCDMAASLSGATRFYNLYGPTETNVCLYHAVSDADLQSPDPLPIGTTIDGATVWLVDAQGRVIEEEDVVGEIWVAGRCVTPGYWAGRDPVAAACHARAMHATGDQGEWRAGVMHYRGRKDRMLKISGYRVELGEVEAAISRHPQLQEAAVRVEPSQPPRLIAHFATRDPGLRLGPLELKMFCAQHLPKYMVPHQVAQHEALPRNANGKIDYRLLAEWPVVEPERVAV